MSYLLLLNFPILTNSPRAQREVEVASETTCKLF